MKLSESSLFQMFFSLIFFVLKFFFFFCDTYSAAKPIWYTLPFRLSGLLLKEASSHRFFFCITIIHTLTFPLPSSGIKLCSYLFLLLLLSVSFLSLFVLIILLWVYFFSLLVLFSVFICAWQIWIRCQIQ